MPKCPSCSAPYSTPASYCASCGKPLKKRSRVWLGILASLAGLYLLGLIACLTSDTKTSSSFSSASSQPTGASESASSSKEKTAVTQEIDAKKKKRLSDLKLHFAIVKDEFNGSTTYRHKAFSKYMNGNGTTIEAAIVDKDVFVTSEYVDEDWIFHRTFTVKVGDQSLEASGQDKEDVIGGGGGVVETVSANSVDSAAIAELIASAGTKPVRVRLEGKYRRDYTLRSVHQKAIVETVELWHLLNGS